MTQQMEIFSIFLNFCLVFCFVTNQKKVTMMLKDDQRNLSFFLSPPLTVKRERLIVWLLWIKMS